jgi:hypothetical protein
MRHIKLIQGEIPFPVNKFEEKTNKEYPYYQEGRKYALCPTCGSSVQILGGNNNPTHSRNNQGRSMYAAHTPNAVEGLHFDEQSKLNCLKYGGNKNNWQKIYERQGNAEENRGVEEYIEENKSQIARDIENIIGFKCAYRERQSRLFEELYESFKANGGLYIASNQFVPEYIPRLIIERANPINCWGSIPNEEVQDLIRQNEQLAHALNENGQFKPHIDVQLVGTLNDDNAPTQIIIKLIFNNGRGLILNRVPAGIQ